MKGKKHGWAMAITLATSGAALADGSRAIGMATRSIIFPSYKGTWQIKIGSNPDFNFPVSTLK